MVFLELLPAVHIALQAMTCPNLFESFGTEWKWDTDTLTKANSFRYQFESSSFLVCFKILLEVLTCLRGLTLKLQLRAIDVVYAYKEVERTTSVLKSMRDNSEREFARIFEETTKLGRKLHGSDFELSQPRVVRRQTHRSNVEATTAVNYFRVSYYNEFYLMRLVSGLTKIQHMAVDFYKEDLPNVIMCPTEWGTGSGR